MTRAFACLLVVAACDLGIGSDPHVDHPCVPGHSRTSVSEACLAPLATTISIDGDTADWAAIPAFSVGPTASVAVAGNGTGDADLFVRVVFMTPPPADAELGLALSPSPVRPASGGSDRITSTASGMVYIKNGLTLAPATPQAQLARTSDGFEMRVLGSWLSYQGAAKLSILGSSSTSPTFDACWGWREAEYKLPPAACEATP